MHAVIGRYGLTKFHTRQWQKIQKVAHKYTSAFKYCLKKVQSFRFLPWQQMTHTCVFMPIIPKTDGSCYFFAIGFVCFMVTVVCLMDTLVR